MRGVSWFDPYARQVGPGRRGAPDTESPVFRSARPSHLLYAPLFYALLVAPHFLERVLLTEARASTSVLDPDDDLEARPACVSRVVCPASRRPSEPVLSQPIARRDDRAHLTVRHARVGSPTTEHRSQLERRSRSPGFA